jgi:hypothetical protein
MGLLLIFAGYKACLVSPQPALEPVLGRA